MTPDTFSRYDLPKLLRFYVITDDRPGPLSPLEQTHVALAAGATVIQYRDKNWTPDRLAEVVAIRELCREYRVPFIVNDHPDLAVQVMADGIHVGQDDMAPRKVRDLLGPEAIVGVSVSTLDELARTDLEPCDYIGTGPVFPTGTKADAGAALGLDGFAEIARRAGIPAVAIGGITADTVAACLTAGAAGVAVISAISRAADPLAAARCLMAAVHGAHRA